MTLFWIVCAALLVVALLFIVLPLWRKADNTNDVLRDTANLEILRDQSAELDADLNNGLLTQDAYEQGKRELQARLLEEVKTTGQPATKPPHNPAKPLAIILAVMLPIFSVSLYLVIGNIDALSPQAQQPLDENIADASGVVRSAAALQALEKRMAQQPGDPNGWYMLARTYTEMQRFSDAANAYKKLVGLVPDVSQLWANYADVLAMKNNRSLQGEPAKLLEKALELDGNNTMALALSGQAAIERGDYVATIKHWQKLIQLLPPDFANLQMYRDAIQRARDELAKQPGGKEKLAQLPAEKMKGMSVVNPAATVSGKVTLNPKLADKVAPTDTLFIFARDAKNPKMLLAVVRKQAKDLPLNFSLDDSMSMLPEMKLSNSAEVIVVARITKSGNPAAQPGDLQGMTAVVKPGSSGLNFEINTVVPQQ